MANKKRCFVFAYYCFILFILFSYLIKVYYFIILYLSS
jgi:hypothetical protein